MEKKPLKVLPSDVQSRLRSDVAIASVSQCVEELVLNSLDAGAVCIAVRLDLTTFNVQVVDNGAGISQDDMKLIGERYSTSKCQKLADLDNLEYYGFRGEALASIRDISTVLEIHSRSRQSSMTYCKLFNHGQPRTVAVSKFPRPCPGTTITVHNLFYNIPVRQKNIFPSLELEHTRYCIEGISLINPSISFSLRNDATGHTCLQTQKSNSVLTAFMYLFGGCLSMHLKPVAIDKEPFHIEGYIGKDGHNKKALQFVYVNNRMVLKTPVHRIITKIMTNCILFRKKPSKDVTGASSPRCMEKYPMYVLNIKCPLNSYDITFDPKKTLVEFKDWETLNSAVETMVTDFLKSENLWYYTETNFLKTAESSNPKQPTNVQRDAPKKTQEETELQVSKESEISTMNTSNILSSKTVFRKPTEILETKTPSPTMIGISNSVQGQEKEDDTLLPKISESHEAVREFPDPVQGQEKEDDSLPPKISESHEAVREFPNLVQGQEKEDDTLLPKISDSHEAVREIPILVQGQGNEDDTLLPKISDSHEALRDFANKLHIDFYPKPGDFATDDEVPIEEHTEKAKQVEPTVSWSQTSSIGSEDPLQEDPLSPITSNETLQLPPTHDLNPSFISLPPDSEFISTMDTLRCKEKVTEGKNLTAAQKISLRLKERIRKGQPEHKDQSKVSRVLQKFRKVSRQKLFETVNLKQNKIGRNVAVLEARSNTHDNAGDVPEVNTEQLDALALNSNNNSIKTQWKSDNRNQILDRKRTNLNCGCAPIQNQCKKSKFMTSESFVMTPRTAFVEVLPLLQRAQRRTDKSQNGTCQEESSSVRNRQNHNSNQSVADAFLDRTFKRPHPVDHTRHYHSSKASLYGRSDGRQGASLSPHTSGSERMGDIDNTEERSEKFINSSEGGFSVRMTPSSSDNKVDKSPEPVQESQGFSLNFTSPDSDSSRHQVSCPSKQLDTKIISTPDQIFPPTLPFEYSTEDSGKPTPSIRSSNDKPSDILLTPLHLTPTSSIDHQMSISPQMAFQHRSSDNKTTDILQTPHCPTTRSFTDPRMNTSNQMNRGLSIITDHLLDSDDTASVISTMEGNLMSGDNSIIEESQACDPVAPCFSQMFVDSITPEISVAKPFESEREQDIEIGSSFQCGQKYNSSSDEKTNTDSYSITDLLSDNSQTAFVDSTSCAVHANSKISESQVSMSKDDLDMKTQESNMTVETTDLEMESQESNMTLNKKDLEMETQESNMTLVKDQFESDGQSEQKMFEVGNDVKEDTCNGDSRDIWIEMTDKNSGKVIHVNQLTGNTVYEKEWMILQQKFDKPGFSNSENILCSRKTSSNISTLSNNDSNNLYGMLLNHLDNNQEERTIKWRNKTNIDSDTENSVIDDMFKQWQNPVHEISNQCGINTEVSHSSRSAISSYQSLNQITFTKDMLSCMQVLGQVDNKFIACLISSTTQSGNKVVVPDLLVMLDQHAAHERVRLEQYISELFEEDEEEEGSDRVKQSEITPPLSLTLRQEDVRMMISFKHEFSRIGIKFTGVEENRNEIKLHSIPACIVEREANELKRGKNSIATQFVEELITEYVEYLKNTSGSRRRLPLALQRILATKACRGAIKFNDILSPAQCKELITALSKCDLPFQCAHGRPSVIPLFKLDRKLFQQTQVKPKPRLDKLMKGRQIQE